MSRAAATVPATISDLRAAAMRAMPRELFDYYFGVGEDGIALTNRNNEDGYGAFELRPRVLRGVSDRCLSTTVLGREIEFPVMLAPAGDHTRAHPDGELASARGAGAAGTLMCVASASAYPMEEITRAATGPTWFQLYYFSHPEINRMLVERAEACGCSAIVLTVDNLVGNREQSLGAHGTDPRLADLWGTGLANLRGFEVAERLLGLDENSRFNVEWQPPGLSWKDVEELRDATKLPLVVKGIQTAEDAVRCVESGASALVVSNHGGHALGDARATVRCLPEIVDAVAGRIEIYLDGGIRTGTDVLKARALGATAVLVGRPMFWGLAVGGDAGVHAMLEVYRRELDVAMAVCGVQDINRVERSLVTEAGAGPKGNTVEQLERLAALLDRGRVTEEEYRKVKAQLIGPVTQT
jgi:isopentenyl diphosphate isomerase/L-lactate dehydrogenase-like FMN-dependent dehydrogenase